MSEDNGHYLDPSTTTERVALCVLHLADGGTMTTREAAEMTRMTWQGANGMLDRASRVVPITKDKDGRWYRV